MTRLSRLIRRFAVPLSVLFTLLLLAATAMAQSTATLRGTVTDPQGAVVPNAKVTITDAAKGVPRVTQSDSSGIYQMPGLVVGTYNVTAEAPGLQTQTVNGIVLNAARTVVQDFKLALPTGKEVVTVTGEAPLIERTTMTVGQVVDEHTVQEIPLNGRHFVDLGLLTAGSVTPPTSGFLTAPLRGQGSFQINTAGNREDTVNFMINGINLNDMVQNQITFQPSINTVQEFKLDNSTYSAQYGRNSGAIVNIATRSGTNDFHGEGFEFVRNNWLDARNYFNPQATVTKAADGSSIVTPQAQSAFKRNNFGGDVGGPIIKNKLFFYGSYEGLRQRQALPINGRVLSDGERAAVTDPISQALLKFIPTQNSSNFVVTPKAGDVLDTPFAGQPDGFVGGVSANVNIDQWTGDIQYVIGSKDNLHGYYAFQRDQRQEPVLQGNTVPGFGDTRASHRQILTLNESHVFSPEVVNEARLGFNRIHITFEPNNLTDPTTLGIDTGNSGPFGLPFVNLTSIGMIMGGPAGFPSGRGDTTGVASDTVSWLHGRHSFKFGGEFRRFINDNFSQDTGTFTINTMGNFFLGKQDAYNVTTGSQPSRIYTNALGFFGMDTIKLTRTVTLEVGVRVDYLGAPTEAAGRFLNFDPTTSQLINVAGGAYPNKWSAQPRLGFAWDMFGNGKTVLRVGYGWMLDQPVTNLVTGLAANPPLAASVNFSGPGTTTWGNAFNQATSAIALRQVDSNFQPSYTQDFNINVQQQLTANTSVMVGAFGNKGTHLRQFRNLNQPINGVKPFPTLTPNSIFTCPNATFPSCALSSITQQDSVGNSNYNALWVTGTRRMTHGLEFQASYTYSHAYDYNSLSSGATFQTIENGYSPRDSYGPSDFDVRHRFTLSMLWELPLHGNRLKNGWQIGTIFQAQSGNPISIVSTSSSKGGNITQLNGLAASNIYPDLIGNPQYVGTVNQWFANTTCDPQKAFPCASGSVFAIPISGTPAAPVYHFGDLGRNALYGPPFNNLDMNLLKDTKITERLTWQFRADFFDILNRPNFSQPGNTAGTGNFGRITSTRFPTGDSGSARQIQLAMKILF